MGTIALVGGDEFRPNCISMDRTLLSRSAHQPPQVVVVPTAAAHQGPRLAANNGIRYFSSLGAEANAAMVLAREDAEQPRFSDELRDADLIYLTGGNPQHLLETLRETAFCYMMEERWHTGALLAGSSAGAMVLGEVMLGGRTGWSPALGFVRRVAVLPHHGQFAPQAIQSLLAMLPPGVAVFGIPTGSAAVSDDGERWEIVGVEPVSVYAISDARAYAPGEVLVLP